MSEREKARRELAEILSKPFPKKKNDPQPPPEDAQVYRIIPGRQKRKWIAQPVAASALVRCRRVACLRATWHNRHMR